jgi:hypothetical protein
LQGEKTGEKDSEKPSLHKPSEKLQSLTDAATKRIENGNSAEVEISKTTAFCIAGLRTLIES